MKKLVTLAVVMLVVGLFGAVIVFNASRMGDKSQGPDTAVLGPTPAPTPSPLPTATMTPVGTLMPSPTPTTAAIPSVVSVANPSPTPRSSPTPTATPIVLTTSQIGKDPASTFIVLRTTEVAPGATLNFQGQGFIPLEQIIVLIQNSDGTVEARLPSAQASKEGRIYEVSLALPPVLEPGNHLVQVTGAASGRSATAPFRMNWIPPKVEVEPPSVKPRHDFTFTGHGFVPFEGVEVHLASLLGPVLAVYNADDKGDVAGRVRVPLVREGDYQIVFLGMKSRLTVAQGFNIQGFTPWVILDSYSPIPYYRMGFKGDDFVPGETVGVYFNKREGEPAARVTVDDNGRFNLQGALEVPIYRGDLALIFYSELLDKETTAGFVVLPMAPALELTSYAPKRGARLGFIGKGWAKNETLHAFLGETPRQEVGTFQSDGDGAFQGAGLFRIPVEQSPGGTPVTVLGDISQVEVTIWFQVQDLMPSAELSAYKGVSGTTIAFSARGFAGGERVTIHLKDRDGPILAEGIADDTGTLEKAGAYKVESQPGDVLPFFMIGEESDVHATTHFQVQAPFEVGQ